MNAHQPVRAMDAPEPGTPIPSHYPLCIACGADHPHSLGVELFAGEGVSVTGHYTVGEGEQGAPGIAHGGVLAAVMDELLGSLNWILMAPAVTYRLQTFFHRPAPVGATLQLSAEVTEVGEGKVQCRGQARLNDVDGPVAVRADGEFRQVPIEHFRKHGHPDYVRQATGVNPWRKSDEVVWP